MKQIYDCPKTGRKRVRTVNTLPTETQQQFQEECDINNIMSKYKTTGHVSHLSRRNGQYADFSELDDYQTMLHKVTEAQTRFDQLPAKLRTRFQNDPGQLITYLQDPANLPEALQLGLVTKNPHSKSYANDLNERDLNAKPKQSTPVPSPASESKQA